MAEPKKFSFGFSKVAKKPALFTPKPVETIEYIKCVEDKTVKLVHEEVVKPKVLPIIPMPPGSSVRDRILEAVKAREAKSGSGKGAPKDTDGEQLNGAEKLPTVQNGAEGKPEEQVEVKPLTLDEMAAKELLENAKMDTEEKKEALVIQAEEGANRKQSTLDDYESMPINDFGLAMLRGMGWDPKKGIGLNEKVVTPTAPQLRPKGMGLGADKALVAQTQPGKTSSEEMVMKKGSMVKALKELPGRIMVRLTLSNTVVSLSEFMVQLVGPTEYNKNSKVMNLDKYNAALESELDRKPDQREIKSEQKSREAYSKPVKREERRSRSPIYQEKSSNRGKSKKKRDRSRNRSSPKRSKQRDSSESDSSDDKYRKRRSPDRRRHKSSKKSKYQSSSSSDDSDHRKKKSKSSKHSKHKSYRSDSDSSPERYKKHKKSRK
ncbi:hypothetical protein GE061_017502 [Apolygus lucorum]|uniref:G-patch domain-containing protein n=1 Tax=Apolygus lucorum TaxID=248454 RepID=A0A8S9XBC7_APOLU|nr:hypothetical protein GE061_017502 [Apolygus lucorum]